MSWLTVIGIGEDGLDGLTRPARTLVEHAEVLVGGERHLAMVPRGRAERLTWRQPITETLPEIAAQKDRRVVVLASGDPLWYGVGALLLRRFGREAMLVLPAPSAFSLAAARMGWPLAECTPLTLHGRPLARLALFLQPGARLLILSED
ncbi:MAG TPA: precorrin-6y C5,15-methyltransferase (decarboxylating) subunit CbiE, partial [Stellaceae bacterium]|nr:precorrin-6y C5,15-methyltransferase (decarboxylating) subunit CbiE [Stellaceae bacterium]